MLQFRYDLFARFSESHGVVCLEYDQWEVESVWNVYWAYLFVAVDVLRCTLSNVAVTFLFEMFWKMACLRLSSLATKDGNS